MAIIRRAISVSLYFIGENLLDLGDWAINLGALIQLNDTDQAGA